MASIARLLRTACKSELHYRKSCLAYRCVTETRNEIKQGPILAGMV